MKVAEVYQALTYSIDSRQPKSADLAIFGFRESVSFRVLSVSVVFIIQNKQFLSFGCASLVSISANGGIWVGMVPYNRPSLGTPEFWTCARDTLVAQVMARQSCCLETPEIGVRKAHLTAEQVALHGGLGQTRVSDSPIGLNFPTFRFYYYNPF